MDAKLKDLWLKALRSGKYRQGRMSLFDGEGYCCLGVLCAVAASNDCIPADVKIDRHRDAIVVSREGVTTALSLPDGTWGLRCDILLEAERRNDGSGDFYGARQTFDQIADWLETAVSTETDLSPADKD